MRCERVQFAVIGAGISGLVCAHRLASLGADVIVLDSSDRVGGRIETIEREGAQYEAGPNTLMAGGRAGTALGALIDELELQDRTIEASPLARRRYIGAQYGLLPLPAGPFAAVTSPLLGPVGIARLAADLVLPARGMAGESVSRFITRRFGRRILDNLVAPFLSGVYAGDAARLEAESVLSALVEAEAQSGSVIRGLISARIRDKRAARAAGTPLARARCITFSGGIAELPRRLHEHLGTRVALRARIEQVQETSEGCDLLLDDGSRLRCEHAIIATDVAAAGAIVSRIPRLAALALSLCELPCSHLAVVSLLLQRRDVPHALDGFGYLNQPMLERRVLGCMFRSSIFPHAAPEGSVLLTAFVGGARHPAAAELSEPALLKLVRTELRERLGIAEGSPPQDVFIRRWKNAIPQFNTGHAGLRQRVARATRHGPITLLGNYLSGLSLPDCIRGAREHAQRLMPARAADQAPACRGKEASCASALS